MDTSIASAVVLPDAQDSPPRSPASPPNGHKRRQSSVSEQEGKRRRLSNDDNDEPRRESIADDAAHEPERRRSGAQVDARERTRGKRLFGAVLGALSQGSSSTAQRRRAEIEKKQQAKLKLQDEENDQRKRERLDKLMGMRRKEQKKFDKETMKIRHANLLDMAHFLYTKTEPRLYYKPWELTPEEEDRIDDQVTDAQAVIDKELDEFEQSREEEQGRGTSHGDAVEADREVPHQDDPVGNQTEGNDASAGNGATNHSETASPKNQDLKEDHDQGNEDNTANGTNGTPIEVDRTETAGEVTQAEEAGKEHIDETGEEMLEAAEDTVIY